MTFKLFKVLVVINDVHINSLLCCVILCVDTYAGVSFLGLDKTSLNSICLSFSNPETLHFKMQ